MFNLLALLYLTDPEDLIAWAMIEYNSHYVFLCKLYNKF